MIKNPKVLEKHIVGENGIGYTLGEDDFHWQLWYDIFIVESDKFGIGGGWHD